MIDEIHNLMEEYWKWLRDKTALRQAGDCVEITTPHLDRRNDYIQIYVRRDDNGGFVITDDGYTLDDLEMSGCKIGSGRRQDMLNVTLNSFGIHQNGNALETRAMQGDFSMRKHNLVQAILAVGDLFYTARPVVASLFNEDVAQWMDASDIRYSPRLKLVGKSKLDHFFDFVIPKSKNAPERILRAINRPNRGTTQAAIFSWEDVKETRRADTRGYVVLNNKAGGDDEDASLLADIKPNKYQIAIENYGLSAVVWARRDDYRAELAA